MAVRYVFVHLPGEPQAVPAGRLELLMRDGQLATSRFQYGRHYLQRPNALDIDPISLPRATESATPRMPIHGLSLFGAIRDAAPDAWGRRVIESRWSRGGLLSEVDYLDHAGSDRAGALDIRTQPDSPPRSTRLPAHLELHYLIEAADRIEAGEPVPAHLAPYFEGGPTLGGMRPKAVVEVAGSPYLAKFPSRTDRRFDVPSIEYATLELARMAGLHVPATRRVTLADGRSVLMIERFDRHRMGDGWARRHMVSALTMLGVSELDSPQQSYAGIADVISQRGVPMHMTSDRIELFRRMVFNILISNDDDHLRNHAFLYDPEGSGWRLSPLYDVVPAPQVANERYLHLGVGPYGRAARLDNALEGAGRFGLTRSAAAGLIGDMVDCVRPWREHFDAWGVAPHDCAAVVSAFRRAADIGLRQVTRLG